MELTSRELWTVLHGMVLGAIYLLAFGGGLAELYSLHPQRVSREGLDQQIRRLRIGLWTMAGVSWFTVISGTWIVYIWYRAKPPAGADLTHYPRAFLLSRVSTAGWHNFGMEWKEHVAWLAPILATVTAYLVQRYGRNLVDMLQLRRVTMALLIAAFSAAAIAGTLGASLTRPRRCGRRFRRKEGRKLWHPMQRDHYPIGNRDASLCRWGSFFPLTAPQPPPC